MANKQITVFSPICPDYHFKEIKKPFGQTERIHDFDGLGVEKGIVYEKLIGLAGKFFKMLERSGMKYTHLLLVADVESMDQVILKKLGIGQKEFVIRCQKTCREINADLKKRGLPKSRCVLMGDFFRNTKYPFCENIQKIRLRLNTNSKLVRSVQKTRLPFHRFWFGLNKSESYQRSLDEAAMYASFGHQPGISKGIILCADSEILSGCYNLLKVGGGTPVFYLKGGY